MTNASKILTTLQYRLPHLLLKTPFNNEDEKCYGNIQDKSVFTAKGFREHPRVKHKCANCPKASEIIQNFPWEILISFKLVKMCILFFLF
jgi:hypothetical protein